MPRDRGALEYDRTTGRWTLAGHPLHCGDGLEVWVGGHWVPVRLEYQDRLGWVLFADDDAVRILPGRNLTARPDPPNRGPAP